MTTNTEPLNEAGDSMDETGMLAARGVALNILHGVLGQKQALDHVLEREEGFKELPPRDRGFCRMLASTTIRRLGQIDDIIAKAIDKPARTSTHLMNILRIGVAQILFMDVPDHAAVDTSVRLAEALDMERQKGFVNGVLRTVGRVGNEWLERQDETRLNTPEWLLKVWIADYGLRTAAEIAGANLVEAPLDITIRDEADRNHWGSVFQASEVAGGSLRRPSGGNITELEGFEDGKWWVQDASAAIPARLFGDIAGKTVVDLCAAPGGKTMQLAAQGAHVIALDRSAQRLKRVHENLERTQLAENVEVIAADAASWRPNAPVDFILLDAPCSATGTVRRHPDVLQLKAELDIERLVRVQEDILENAFDMLAPGGMLIYCTCSLQKAEGEDQMERFFARHADATKVAISSTEIGDMNEPITENGDLRILPFHRSAQGGMDGFYVCRIKKN